MKYKIIQPDGETKLCPYCKHSVFRCSTRTRYFTRKDKGDKRTTGQTYDLRICDKCGYRERFNFSNWHGESPKED